MRRLGRDDLEQFRRDGYLVVEGLFDESDLEPLWNAYETRLDQVARQFAATGLIADTFAEFAFGERYIRIARMCPNVYSHLDITLPVVDDMAADAPVFAHPAVFDLLRHPAILDVAEDILGPEIVSNPTQHLRLKVPGGDDATTWHQDLAGLLDEALDSDILTVWVALTDATVENGCLLVIPGSHRHLGDTLTRHVIDAPGESNYIPNTDLAPGTPVALSVRRGGLVLFDKLTHHASLPNRSSDIRMSFDLRYQPAGQASGRPAFPCFVARSRAAPGSALRDAQAWAGLWEAAREAILAGNVEGPIFETARWSRNSPLHAHS
ncbi:MAG: phytanoyl-CoA dioxygenase family protein [bacterium]|nr:phytanoyl-CoA dioxygenase family protein [bacterium]